MLGTQGQLVQGQEGVLQKQVQGQIQRARDGETAKVNARPSPPSRDMAAVSAQLGGARSVPAVHPCGWLPGDLSLSLNHSCAHLAAHHGPRLHGSLGSWEEFLCMALHWGACGGAPIPAGQAHKHPTPSSAPEAILPVLPSPLARLGCAAAGVVTPRTLECHLLSVGQLLSEVKVTQHKSS